MRTVLDGCKIIDEAEALDKWSQKLTGASKNFPGLFGDE